MLLILQLVPMRDFTTKQLAQHDGSDPELPMLIAIRGVVFDVSTGKNFYGPNGEPTAAGSHG
jgi:membrane-associated progesterone receptor component